MQVREFFYIPNLISVARMLSVFPIAWLIGEQNYVATFWVVFVAGMTDSVDGWLAKQFGMQSELGGVLDPMADKVLLFSCFALMVVHDFLPMWLFILVIARDAVIVTGGVLYHHLIEPVRATPLLAGKITTFFQILLVLVVFGNAAFSVDLAQLQQINIILVVALTILSGGQYVWIWGVKAWQTSNNNQSN